MAYDKNGRFRCDWCNKYSVVEDSYTPFGCADPTDPEPYDPTDLCVKCAEENYQRWLKGFAGGGTYGSWCKSNGEMRAARESSLVWIGNTGTLKHKETGALIHNLYIKSGDVNKYESYLKEKHLNSSKPLKEEVLRDVLIDELATGTITELTGVKPPVPIGEECNDSSCHVANIKGHGHSVSHANPLFTDVLELFDEEFGLVTAMKRNADGYGYHEIDAKDFLAQALTEQREEIRREERLRCETHISVIKEATEHGRKLEREEFVRMIEGVSGKTNNGSVYGYEKGYNAALDDLLTKLKEV